MKKRAYHGGAFFEAIGSDFSVLENTEKVIAADVLDAWFDPSPKVLEKISSYLSFALKTSPPTYSDGLVATIADYRGVLKQNIIVGAGSSAIMFSFFPNILNWQDRVLILDPMYGEYAHILEHVIPVVLKRHLLQSAEGFKLHPEKIQREINSFTPAMVILVNPNSPTGNYCDGQLILDLVTKNPNILFVIDETYIEYVGRNHSLERFAGIHKNLIIIKSMSKVYALSGARVAYMIADKSILQKFSYLMPPWAVSLIGQISAVEALKDLAYYDKKYAQTHLLRQEMQASLSQLANIKIYSSVANFFLIELCNTQIGADEIIKQLRGDSIYLRNCDSMSKQFKNNFLRIAVKDNITNKKIVDALLKTIMGKQAQPSLIRSF